MKHVWCILLLVVVAACKKSELDEVGRFVQSVKRENYREMNLPNFNVSHIDALLRHASDEQVVATYPRPLYSSHYNGPVEVGLVMLYAIEAIRLQIDWPYMAVKVYDDHDLSRDVPLSEVLPHYQKWWAENKGKKLAELGATNPLEGSGLTWVVLTTGE